MPSLGQEQVKMSLAGSDKIKQLIAMSDEELMATTGMDKKLQAFKDHLTEADALVGKARTKFIEKLEERLAPRVDGYDLGWMIKDAKREANPKSEGAEGPACC